MPKRVIVEVDLPKDEAESLAARAKMENIKSAKYLGVHVMRSAYGPLHPDVVAYETGVSSGDDLGQPGTEKV